MAQKFPKPRRKDDGATQSDAPKVAYPPDHQPGMQVPQGGSMCANCKYLGQDQTTCTSNYFIRWNGSDQLPAPADEYCSDWYEPKTMEDSGTEEIRSASAGDGSPTMGVAEEQG